MHLKNGLLHPEVAVATLTLTAVALAWSFKKIQGQSAVTRAPAAICAGAIFLAQACNYPLSGGSAHLLGAGTAAILLGPHLASVILALVVAIQALIFKDGGILAYGTNALAMAVVAPHLAAWLWRKFSGSKSSYCFPGLAAFLAGGGSVMAASMVCSLSVSLSSAAPVLTAFELVRTQITPALIEGTATAIALLWICVPRGDLQIAAKAISAENVLHNSAKSLWVFAFLFCASLIPFTSSSGHVFDNTLEKLMTVSAPSFSIPGLQDLFGGRASFWSLKFLLAAAGAFGSFFLVHLLLMKVERPSPPD